MSLYVQHGAGFVTVPLAVEAQGPAAVEAYVAAQLALPPQESPVGDEEES